MRIHLLWYNLLYESFLTYGTDLHHYRILSRQTKGVIALFRIPGTREWLTIGHFYEKETLIHTINLFCRFLQEVKQKSRKLYLVEHILFREEEKTGLLWLCPGGVKVSGARAASGGRPQSVYRLIWRFVSGGSGMMLCSVLKNSIMNGGMPGPVVTRKRKFRLRMNSFPFSIHPHKNLFYEQYWKNSI
ncbi:MAG: hypothetical protein LUE93_15160 [Bacteroides sp.]|nr:hypothetical protein [Bacteroides sp.]